MSMNINAAGSVQEDGTPIVTVTVTFVFPLDSTDSISKLLKQAGTQAVLALGAAREAQQAAEQGQGDGGQAEPAQEVQQCVMSPEEMAAQLAEYAKQDAADAGSGSC